MARQTTFEKVSPHVSKLPVKSRDVTRQCDKFGVKKRKQMFYFGRKRHVVGQLGVLRTGNLWENEGFSRVAGGCDGMGGHCHGMGGRCQVSRAGEIW